MTNSRARLARTAAVFTTGLLAHATALAQTSAPASAVHGRLTEYQGLTVLEIWGTPEQAGYAHGYLLGERIVPLVDDFMLSEKVVPNTALYETILLPSVRRQFVWDEAHEAELRALARGIRDRVGPDGFRSRKLGRELRLEDLMAANALADWFGLLCSTFSAWGPLTTDGQTITARNLDFPSAGGMEKTQLILVHRGDGQARPWVGVTWPGMIGVYTGMNRDGVTMLVHDAPGLPASHSDGFTPRALILREALSAARPETFAEDVQHVFQQRRVMVGNNVHVSAPWREGLSPAAVFEYDAHERGQGVTIRRAEQNPVPLRAALWCTNHMCVRQQPIAAERFERLAQRLSELANTGKKLDPAAALKLILEVRQPMTLHSVVLEPARRVMHLYIPAITDRVVEFRAGEWLDRPIGEAAADVPDHANSPARPAGARPSRKDKP